MRTRFLVLAAVAIAVAVAVPAVASAHDLQLVVKLPPDTPDVVVLEAGFDDDTPADDAKVTITAADGTVVTEGKTDDRGVCRLARPGPGKYTAVVDAFGHRDSVEFEILGSGGGETYAGWRPDKTLGLAVGVFGLLTVSVGHWWLRRGKARPA